jgi:hypothetical protein
LTFYAEFLTNISEQPIGPFLKGQAVQVDYLTQEDGADNLSRNVSIYQSTLRNIPEKRTYYLRRGEILKSRIPPFSSDFSIMVLISSGRRVRSRKISTDFPQLYAKIVHVGVFGRKYLTLRHVFVLQLRTFSMPFTS